MRKISYLLLLCLPVLAFELQSEIVGQKANYALDSSSDRTHWMIKSGRGEANITEFRADSEGGPAYVVSIGYEFSVRMVGTQKGNIGLLVPATMFTDQFYADLVKNHPVNFTGFSVDYEGMSKATDANGNDYEDCMMLRIFDIDLDNPPLAGDSNLSILWHKIEGDPVIENPVMHVKAHPNIPVLRAVQIDFSGEAYGFELNAGMDFIPADL
jgi:hypothetical protein